MSQNQKQNLTMDARSIPEEDTNMQPSQVPEAPPKIGKRKRIRPFYLKAGSDW